MHEHQLISEYPQEYFEGMDWGKRFLAWLSMCGISNVPDVITEGFVIGALQNEYSGHSLEEIETALRMYVMGELGDELEAFNNFNLKFLSKVMKAYRIVRKKVANEYEEIKFKLNKPAPVVPSEKELDVNIARIIWDDFTRIQNEMEVHPWSYKCDLLIKYNRIPHSEVDALIERAREAIKNSIATTTDKRERGRIADTISNPENFLAAAVNRAKQWVYVDWLKLHIAGGITFIFFETLINDIIAPPPSPHPAIPSQTPQG